MNNSKSEGRVESNWKRMTDPYDEELDSAGNLANLRWKAKPGPTSPLLALDGMWVCAKRPREANGVWRRGGQKVMCVKRGDPDDGPRVTRKSERS